MIDDYRGKLILARNKQADVIICGGCIARGGEEIDQMLRERADLMRKELPARLEQIRQQTEDCAAWVESLVGRLQVPSYAAYKAAMKVALENELLAEDIDDPWIVADYIEAADVEKIALENELLADDYYNLPEAERVRHVVWK